MPAQDFGDQLCGAFQRCIPRQLELRSTAPMGKLIAATLTLNLALSLRWELGLLKGLEQLSLLLRRDADERGTSVERRSVCRAACAPAGSGLCWLPTCWPELMESCGPGARRSLSTALSCEASLQPEPPL